VDQLTIVSGDGHVAAPVEVYGQYLEDRYKPELLELIRENVEYLHTFALATRPKPDVLDVFDTRNAARTGGEFGSFDIGRRLREMDAEGIAAEIIHPATQVATLPFFAQVNKPRPADVRAAGQRAYHRWLADFMSESDGRMIGVAEPGPCLDLAETLKELRWCAEHGYRSVFLPGSTADDSLPPLSDPYYEPFWSACAELGLVLGVHAGWGQSQQRTWEVFKTLTKVVEQASDDPTARLEDLAHQLAMSDDSPLRLDLGPRRVIWQLMLGGVFDRHPTLKLALVEIRADWVPATIAHLDDRFAKGTVRLKMRPSEYYRQHIVVTPSSPHRCEVEMRGDLGVDQFLFGADFPHWEGTWPNTQDWIRVAFAGVPVDDVRKILGGNAIDVYGLDATKLAKVAERIGPKASEVLAGGASDAVGPALLQDFNRRNRIHGAAEQVDTDILDAAIEEDVELLSATR
jgi:predicted TIM-barrel fold metal-dependent hydrolase